MNRPKGVIGIGILAIGIGLLAIYLVFTNAMQPSTVIPFGTAFAIANLCLWLGFALAILGTALAVLGDWKKGGRVRQPKDTELATCGNCNAPVQEEALRCPSCGVEFGS